MNLGKAKAMFAACLAMAVRDILERPGEPKERTVSLSVHLTPVVLQDGDVVDADVAFSCVVKTPKFCVAGKPSGCTRNGTLFFVPEEEEKEVNDG
jgi:hypothetical protein